MKNCTIKISDVENGWVVSIIASVGTPAEGSLGPLGFMTGFVQQGAARTVVCKSWGEVIAFLSAAEEGVTKAQDGFGTFGIER